MIEDTAQTVALTIETSMVDSYEHTASYSWTCTKCEHYHAMVTVPRGVPLLCEECGTPMYVGVPTPVWDANSGSSEWSFGYTSVDPSRLAHLERIESALLWLNEAEHKYYRMGRLLDRLNDCPDLLLAIEQLRNSEVTDKLLGKSI
jgi:hypothetical protein